MKRQRLASGLALGCALLAMSCNDSLRPDATGSIALQVVIPPQPVFSGPARSPAQPAGVLTSATATATSGSTTKTITLAGGSSSASFTGTITGLPVGSYTVIVQGYINTEVDYYGQTSGVSVTANNTSNATVNFQLFAPTLNPFTTPTTWSFSPAVTITAVPNATGYIVEADRFNTFPNPTRVTTTGGAAYFTASDTGSWYVRARATNTVVTTGGVPSATQSIRVVTDLRPSGTGSTSPASLGFFATKTTPLDSLNIYPASDLDWFQVSDCNGDTLTVTAQAVRLSPPSPLNSSLLLFSASTGRLLAANDNADSTDARVGIRMAADGNYVVAVAGSGNTVGHYKLVVAATAGNNNNASSCKVNAFPVTTVSTGVYHSCSVRSGGVVDCWGYNQYGELGDGTTITRSAPTRVSGSTTFNSVTAGAYHSCALTAAGAAYCWGLNGNGQLGDGTTTNHSVPAAVSGGLTFSSLAAGDFFTCGRTTAGAIYCWGGNGAGQLGNNSTTQSTTPVREATNLSTWASVSVGARHACGLTTGNLVYCWGLNDHGQLATGDTVHRASPYYVGSGYVAIAAGGYHSCALLSGGAAYCWGRNDIGQLGITSYTDAFGPSPVSGGLAFSSLSGGRLQTCGLVGTTAYCWGNNFDGQVGDNTTNVSNTPVAVVSSPGFTSISSGGFHTCGVAATTGNSYCWGWNGFGQVGNATALDGVAPVVVPGFVNAADVVTTGHEHTCTVKSAAPGAVYCWGFNASGQLGDGSTVDHTSPSMAGSLTDYAAVAGGADHTCAIRGGTLVYCWGSNTYGQLGNGTTTPSTTPTPASMPGAASAISSGDDHSCALTTTGAAYCWGRNPDGRVGNGTAAQQNSPVPVSGGLAFSKISAGGYLSCGVTTGGAAYCWGDNSSGGLGNSGTTSSTVPVKVTGTQTWATVSAGLDYACGLTTAGTAYCWGNNADGQLGIGSSANSTVPAAVSGGLTWKVISTSRDGTVCGITTSNLTYCWGINFTGQVGDGTYTYRNVPTLVMAAVTFQAIQAGDVHTCAVSGVGTGSSTVFCWGNNERGELGYSPTTVLKTPTAVVTGPAAAPGYALVDAAFSFWRPVEGGPVPGPRTPKRLARPPRQGLRW
jgi:alpha-tubulin suppressor-like RCC1 family protein